MADIKEKVDVGKTQHNDDGILPSMDNVSTCSSISVDNRKKTSAAVGFGRPASFFNVLFSGFALLSDGYQSGVISFVNLFLKQIYGTGVFDSTMASRLTYSLFVGEIVGQLFFGLVIDRIGRKIGLISTTILVILGAALSAASSGATPTGLLWMMVVTRGLLGVGVGGEFPCSSVSAGEASDTLKPSKRGALFTLVTQFVIDLGYVVAAIVPLILLAIFKDSLEPTWRLCLALGCIPPLSVLYFRLRMADSEQYRSRAIRKRVPYMLIMKRYWFRLFLASSQWFVYDFISYPCSAFSSIILDSVAGNSSLIIVVAWNILLYAFYLPGCVLGASIVDRIGRRKTMSIGFLAQGAIGLILGGVYGPISTNCFPMFVILYGIFMATGEVAGGVTGLNSTEFFPTAVRGTCYSIAAAIGKVGAVVGSLVYAQMQESMGGIRGPFLFGSALAIATSIFVFFGNPEIGPEGLEEEDAAFKVYLEENGFDVTLIGIQTGVITGEKTEKA
ncbi:major facilitator superfamily domain-containing protein [Halteromyces radiatus]|uniref:major facilitator superfamily domain-containing protein n=1 Tax=Halteromyces radiatus TaxID=101107 RepID=UPI00221E458A|nr:major facilitator superfamily domain-containing protein [Halteromyces radiatus]KAI8093069.1 major facilitator superfamily domain-containing protein [Halteromyces radiatus]